MQRIFKFFTLFLFFTLILTGCAGIKTKQPQEASPQTGAPSAAQVDHSQQPATAQPQQAEIPASSLSQQVEVPAGNTSRANQQTQSNTDTGTPEQNEPPAVSNAPAQIDTPEEKKTYSLKVGDYFPLFTLPDLNGNKVSSAEIFAGNKVTIVNFWGTFCRPCITEMPGLEKLRQKYFGQGFGLIGIVVDSQNVDKAKYIANALGTGYPHLLDDGRFSPKIYTVPQTFLVDSGGKVLQTFTGARREQEFSKMIEPYLK